MSLARQYSKITQRITVPQALLVPEYIQSIDNNTLLSASSRFDSFSENDTVIVELKLDGTVTFLDQYNRSNNINEKKIDSGNINISFSSSSSALLHDNNIISNNNDNNTSSHIPDNKYVIVPLSDDNVVPLLEKITIASTSSTSSTTLAPNNSQTVAVNDSTNIIIGNDRLSSSSSPNITVSKTEVEPSITVSPFFKDNNKNDTSVVVTPESSVKNESLSSSSPPSLVTLDQSSSSAGIKSSSSPSSPPPSSPPPSSPSSSSPSSSSSSSSSSVSSLDQEKRKLTAKLSIVYSYLDQGNIEKSLQQLQILIKKQETSFAKFTKSITTRKKENQQNQKSTKNETTIEIEEENQGKQEIEKEESVISLMIELYYLRGSIHLFLFKNNHLAKEDFLTIFTRFSQRNSSVNDLLVNHFLPFYVSGLSSSSSSSLSSSESLEEAYTFVKTILPIMNITKNQEKLESYLTILIANQQYNECIQTLDEVNTAISSTPFSTSLITSSPSIENEKEEGINEKFLIPFYITCYESLYQKEQQQLQQLQQQPSTDKTNQLITEEQLISASRLINKIEDYYLKALQHHLLNYHQIGKSAMFGCVFLFFLLSFFVASFFLFFVSFFFPVGDMYIHHQKFLLGIDYYQRLLGEKQKEYASLLREEKEAATEEEQGEDDEEHNSSSRRKKTSKRSVSSGGRSSLLKGRQRKGQFDHLSERKDKLKELQYEIGNLYKRIGIAYYLHLSSVASLSSSLTMIENEEQERKKKEYEQKVYENIVKAMDYAIDDKEIRKLFSLYSPLISSSTSTELTVNVSTSSVSSVSDSIVIPPEPSEIRTIVEDTAMDVSPLSKENEQFIKTLPHEEETQQQMGDEANQNEKDSPVIQEKEQLEVEKEKEELEILKFSGSLKAPLRNRWLILPSYQPKRNLFKKPLLDDGLNGSSIDASQPPSE
jgi:hypothetical protein